MELIKETVKVSETVCSGSTQVMADGDVCIPDIKPDMLKILQVDAMSCITDAEVLDGKLNISGRVCVTVLYVPDRENEKVRSVEASFDFSQKVENRKILSEMNPIINSNVERLEFSAINSRKLRIKAVVGIDYEIITINETEIAGGIDSSSAEVKTQTLKMSEVCDLNKYLFSVKENIEVPNGQESINEILKTDVKISDTEYKTVSGKIILKGTACVCVLYTDDDCNIEFIESEIPFTEVVDADGVTEESICDIDYSIMNISSNVMEDNDGDRRVIALEIDAAAQIKALNNTEIEIISDCYEPFKKTELKKTELKLEESVERPSVQSTLRDIIEFPDEAPEVTGVYNVVARPIVLKAELQKNKLLCEGKIEAYILYLSDSNENPIYSMKKEIPFSYMMDCSFQDESFEPKIKAEIKHVSYNLNAAGELELRCILHLNADVVKKQSIEIIDEAEETDMENKGGIIVYFVQNGDTLWETAKRYGVPQQEIIKFNNMEDEELKQGMRLFIPACQ